MIKIACPKHETDHLIKPTDAAQLIKYYMQELVTVGYQEPLPNIEGLSGPIHLLAAMCPQADLERIKAANQARIDSAKRPTLSKVWQETFLRGA